MRFWPVGVFFLLLFPVTLVSANTVCPLAGQRPAVASDAAVQNGTIDLGTCYDPQNAAGISQGAEEAKQYLKSILKPATSCVPAQDQFNKVNDAFAICAARFLKTFNEQYGGAVVTRAWQTNQCETAMCAKGPPGVGNVGCGGFARIAVSGGIVDSNHTRGVALDVSAGSKQELMIAFANRNPQFGVCFPLASWDKVHMVLAGIGGGERCPAPNKPCDGVNFDPNSIQRPTAGDIRQAQMLQQPAGPQRLADVIRQYASPTSAATSASQPLSAATQNTVSSVFANPQLASLTNTETTSTGQGVSTADLLNSLLEDPSKKTAHNTTSVGAEVDPNSAVQLTPPSNAQANASDTGSQTGYYVSPHTFVSSDLKFDASNPSTQLSPAQATIQQIRTRMETVTQYLTPFGAKVHPVISY